MGIETVCLPASFRCCFSVFQVLFQYDNSYDSFTKEFELLIGALKCDAVGPPSPPIHPIKRENAKAKPFPANFSDPV